MFGLISDQSKANQTHNEKTYYMNLIGKNV